MKGCPPAGRYDVRWWKTNKETAMKEALKLACVGLDCHRNFSVASGRDESGRIAWRRRLDHADRNELKKELSSWPQGTPVILEGTFGWGWMSDELREAKLDPHLSSGRKVAAWRQARGLAKSNKRDADLLSELWGEPMTMRNGVIERWWEVWCPPPEVRDQREWLRYRMSLVRMQTAMKNQVHATLHRHGLVQPFSDLFGVAGRKWLLEVCRDDSSMMSQSGRRTLQGRLALLAQLRHQIASATRRFHATIRRCPDVRRLTTLPGVSTVLGYTIAAEIGVLDRFRSGRDLASYSLLAPISDDSGDERDGPPIGRHVGKAGRRTLKWAWIEAARNAVRKSPRMKGVFDRYTDNGKYNRGRGYIVVAHQLCLIGYAMWKNQTPYQETPPPRPGQQKAEIQRQAGIQPSADEFCALAATGKEAADTRFKESDEKTRSKKLKKVCLVRERASPSCDMATAAQDRPDDRLGALR
jgi:transposase